MKTLLPLLLITVLLGRAQNPLAVGLWQVKPNPVCAGDSVKVHFMFSPPTNTANVYTFFKLITQASTVTAWYDKWEKFYDMGKEHLPNNSPGDTCRYLWLHIPSNFTTGTMSVQALGTYSMSGNFSTMTVVVNGQPTITITSPTICPGQQVILNPSGANTYYYSGGSQIISPTVTTNYTITGMDNNFCKSTTTVNVNVVECTGIEENPINPINPIARYFDMLGREIVKGQWSTGELIIELTGRNWRKFITQ